MGILCCAQNLRHSYRALELCHDLLCLRGAWSQALHSLHQDRNSDPQALPDNFGLLQIQPLCRPAYQSTVVWLAPDKNVAAFHIESISFVLQYATILATLGHTSGSQIDSHLAPNHFHWVAKMPCASLFRGMKWFLGDYTSRLNHRHKECGCLFSGRHKALPLDRRGNNCLKRACDQVQWIAKTPTNSTKHIYVSPAVC
jgi:hypothetical protein